MGYISDTAKNRTHYLFRLKREPMPLGHSDGHYCALHVLSWFNFFCLRTLTTLFCKQWGQGPESFASPDSIVQPNMILVIF